MSTVLLKTNTPQYRSDICDIMRLFAPDTVIVLEGIYDCILEHISINEKDEQTDSFTLADKEGKILAKKTVTATDVYGEPIRFKRMQKRALKLALYTMLKEYTRHHPAWGSLTGIRPTAVGYELLRSGETLDKLTDVFDVRRDKAYLVEQILHQQEGLVVHEPKAVDIYVGIPFCASRCAYCSFAADEYGRWAGDGAKRYMDALETELNATRELIDEKGFFVRAVYVGGGTPTALDEELFERLMSATATLFVKDGVEFTVEAGRPDTITDKKIESMIKYAVERISINPQTMNDATLETVGRRHTADDIVRVYKQARPHFSVINMDLIAGLPGENAEHFANTLGQVISLEPENITVHTLALKKGTKLRLNGNAYPPLSQVHEMLDFTSTAMQSNGYAPYYMYRQKYMTDNMENVGYAKKGTLCRYNVDIMEETTSILACGAGAISKRVYPTGGRIERAPDVRDIEGYITRIDEMTERKRKLFEEEI